MQSLQNALISGAKRISVAPMIDWTTSDFCQFARLFNPFIYLYTEMVSTSAILQGDTAYQLRFYDNEPPLVLQLGGNSPDELAQCAVLGACFGYSEINLNVGCPSGRVQEGNIGACLMKTPAHVGDCVKAMRQVCDLPITVKHRIGVDTFDSYEFMADFVANVADAGCRHFVVHARIAWLNGLSPKQNREIPPLRYDDVYRLKQDFPQLFIEINGGIKTVEEVWSHLNHVDGVMIGREAYHNPYLLAKLNALWGKPIPSHRQIFEELLHHLEQQKPVLTVVSRHYLGLFFGLTGARVWRQNLSGQKTLSLAQIRQAGEQVLEANGL